MPQAKGDWMVPFVFNGEEANFKHLESAHPFFEEAWGFVFTCLALYVCMIFVVRPMKCPHTGDKEKDQATSLKLKTPLILWNLFLAVFSIMGFIKISPYVFEKAGDFQYLLCGTEDRRHFNGVVGLWLYFFCFSKSFELIDTFFLVANCKPVILLHWYHHVTVLVYCWSAYIDRSSNGLCFAWMNFAVHSIMYTYYFLMQFKSMRWLRKISLLITIIQILQMVVGFVISVATVYMQQQEEPCHTSTRSSQFGAVMYFSYFILFAKLFIEKNCVVKKNAKKQE